MEREKYYITTAIDYPNAEPHIGHAYQKVIADVLARWHKLLGFDVFFLTGTDEHGKKIQEAAQKQDKSPKQFVDELSEKFKEAWKILNVEPNRFIRTTDEDHKQVVQEVITKCNQNSDVYKGFYEGLYCVGCEAYYTEKDSVDGNCPIHNRPLGKIKEESYFFRLSKYRDFLLDLYNNHPEFILPDERRNEMANRVKEGLKDLSISRTSFNWGIPFPLDQKHVTYVWFDALFSYLSGSGKNKEFWPANVHLLGKDNGWFHTVYWPSFLKSAGYPLPETVFVHGFLTFNGQKISKSLGNTISPKVLAEKYSPDSIRYFLCRNFVFGEDGDFSEPALVRRHNDELANKLGNLVSRISALAEKYGLEQSVPLEIEPTLKKVEKHFVNFAIDKALAEIFSFIDFCNEYTQKHKPWETKDPEILWQLSNAIKDIAILLWPFMPETSEKIAETFHFTISLDELKKPLSATKITKSEPLFKKIELEITKPALAENQRKEIKISISPEISQKGINVCAAIFKNANITNKNNYLEELKKEFANKVDEINIINNKIISAYKEFYRDKDMLSGAEGLIGLIKKNKMFPDINTVVDSYNLISTESLISMGAHDASKINGEIKFIITKGDEKFVPLGEKQQVKVNPEEYACVDNDKVLCRMDIKQCDETKITKKTKDFIIYAQGNKNVDDEYLKKSLVKACELIKKVSESEYQLINIEQPNIKVQNSNINKSESIEGIMTIVDFAEWQKLDLRAGQIENVENVEGADKLYKLTVDLGSEKRTLVAGLKKFYSAEELKGKRCVVFVNLTPRKMRGIESQGMILAAVSADESQVTLIAPEKDVPLGSKIM